LKFSDIAEGFLRFEAGNGENIHLWLDSWHPDGILLEKYGYRAVYDAQSNVEAKKKKEVMWRQSYLLLFVMVIGFGDLLGLMP
jgi:hypothetical protein